VVILVGVSQICVLGKGSVVVLELKQVEGGSGGSIINSCYGTEASKELVDEGGKDQWVDNNSNIRNWGD
jgi:hypothetical protein